MLHYEAVAPNLLERLKFLLEIKELSDYYLVGGTSLALRLGHRWSVDIDFFTHQPFDIEWVKKATEGYFDNLLFQSNNGISGFSLGVKTDIVSHRYSLLFPLEEIDGVRMVSMADVAAMKINAINNRGKRKDFTDLYFLLNEYSFGQILDFFVVKYVNQNISIPLRSLVYFEDADTEKEEIDMIKKVSWAEIKERIENEHHNYISEMRKNI